MHLDNAEKILISGDYIQPTADAVLSQRLIQKINPTGPLDYTRQTKPLLIESQDGAALVAVPDDDGPSFQTPGIVRASLPADQKAFSPFAIPALNLSPQENTQSAGLVLQSSPGGGTSPIVYIIVLGVLLFILSKF